MGKASIPKPMAGQSNSRDKTADKERASFAVSSDKGPAMNMSTDGMGKPTLPSQYK